MPEIQLQKLIVNSTFIPKRAFGYANGFIESLIKTNQQELLWNTLQPCKVIKLKNNFYAMEHLSFVAVAKKNWPEREIDCQILSVKTEQQLLEKLVLYATFSALPQMRSSQFPMWQRNICTACQLPPLFPMSLWSKIIPNHRSAFYQKDKQHQAMLMKPIDLQITLSGIPQPKGNCKC